MSAQYPSAFNTFIPSHDATNKMVIDFARNIKDFAVNKYSQIVPVKAVTGYYLKMTVEERARILHADLRNFVWADGQPAPEGNDGLESFEYFPYRTIRRAFAFLLGDLTIDQASWDIQAQHAAIKAQQAMTARTQLAITAATTTANWDASHVLDVTAITGNTGNWAQSTTARQDIKRSLETMAELILDDTVNAVKLDELVLVISSGLAAALSQCQEIVDYIKGSPDALAQVKGELPGENTYYGLPNKLYGFPLVVEATRKVTSKKGATVAKSQILPTATPFMVSRPGSLVGVAGAPNFSTLTCFAQEEMTVETNRDTDNRRTKGRVVDNVAYALTAPVSGGMFQAAA